jgi:tetratricopeptide (TPR) repeat protein
MFILLLFIHILLKKFKISYQLNKYHFIAILALCILAAFYAFTKKIVWFWEKDNIIPFTDKIMYSSYALTFYLKQFFLPIKQIAIHPYPDISGKELFLKWWFYIFSWIFTLIAAFKFYTKKYFLELFGLAFFILNISIVLHFISIEGRLIVAERYPYLAYSGLIITTSSLISRYLNNRILKNCVISIISIIFSILISIRTDIWKNTETLFYDVLNKNPKISFAWQNLGSYYLEKKQYNKAYKCYEIAIKLEPNNTQYILNKSFAALALNNKEMAIKLLNEVISKSKSDEEISFAILTLGQIEANTGNTNKANYYYTLAIKKYPKNYKAYLQKSFLFSYPGNIVNIDSAIYYANKAVEYNINYADAYNTLSWLYLLKNNILLSKQYALKSIRANRYYSLGYNTLGYIYQIEKKYDSAFYMYQLALNIDSNLLEVRRNRAWIYFQNNNFKNALIDYNYILKHNPNDWIALTNRAFCYIKLNQFNNAILDFKHILKLFPDSAESYYNLGWSFLQTNLLDSALNYYNEAIKINPQYYRAVLDRGIIYFKKNNLNEALKDFSKLKYINPTNGEVYFWIAKVYEKKSDVYNACLNYKTAYNKGFLEAKNFLNLCEKYIVGNEK